MRDPQLVAVVPDAIDLERGDLAGDQVIVLGEEDSSGQMLVDNGVRLQPPPPPRLVMDYRDALLALHDIAARPR